MSTVDQQIPVVVAEIIKLNELVTRFEFERQDAQLFPAFSGGSHTVIEMQDGEATRRNPYTIMSDPARLSRYAISVRRDDEGRGGSLFLHNNVKVGDKLKLSRPVNLFALDLRAKKHLLIAGGIGITPFLAQTKQLDYHSQSNWELHYSCRSEALNTYVDELTSRFPHRTHIYYDDQKQSIALESLLARQPLGTHVYVCGPKGMIDWVCNTAARLNWSEQAIHYEEFLAPQPGKAFDVTLSASKKTIHVAEHESLLEAIERAGVEPPFMCRGGACGQCETAVLECDGTLLHRDHWLDDEEKASAKKIMPCVSRFEGKTLVLDR